MVGTGPGRVAAVVGGQDQNVIFPDQFHQLRQTAVEQLQPCGDSLQRPAVAPGRVEVHEVGEDDGLVSRCFHLFDGGVKQRIQAGRLHLLVIPQLA